MEVKLAVLADAANVSQEGKLNILGGFSVLWAPRFPTRHPKMTLVLKLEGTAGENPGHKLGIRVVDADGQMVAPPVDGAFEMQRPFMRGDPTHAQIIIEIVDAVFPRGGTYSFEILIDGHHKESLPLHVLQIQEASGTSR